MEWESNLQVLGTVLFPMPTYTRILMMPIVLNDLNRTVPPGLTPWLDMLQWMVDRAPLREGLGFLTIDERAVGAGFFHRRPGLHVDGWKVDGGGSWGGGWGGQKYGMVVAANIPGSIAYTGRFHGDPAEYGNCEHLRKQLIDKDFHVLKAGVAYVLGGLTLHESLPMQYADVRQFLRLSLPSEAAWNVSNTPSPYQSVMALVKNYAPPRPKEFTDYDPT